MFLIESYKSIGPVFLDVPISEIEKVLGKTDIKVSKYFADEEIGMYSNGIAVSYHEKLSSFIGVLISLKPVHEDFHFLNKNYNEVLEYFNSHPGNIYLEDKTSLFSEYLGITVYFEDGIKEVGTISKNYIKFHITNLELYNKS